MIRIKLLLFSLLLLIIWTACNINKELDSTVKPEDNRFTKVVLDLTGISQIEIYAQASPRYEAHGGMVELRLGSPTGK